MNYKLRTINSVSGEAQQLAEPDSNCAFLRHAACFLVNIIFSPMRFSAIMFCAGLRRKQRAFVRHSCCRLARAFAINKTMSTKTCIHLVAVIIIALLSISDGSNENDPTTYAIPANAEPKWSISPGSVSQERLDKSASYYLDGILVGHRSWYDNAQLYEETPYWGGRNHGIQRRWYKNGILWSSTYYRNGTRDSYEREFYPNGRIKSERYYHHDLLHGPIREWDESGILKPDYPFFFIRARWSHALGWVPPPVSEKEYRDACKKDSSLVDLDRLEIPFGK